MSQNCITLRSGIRARTGRVGLLQSDARIGSQTTRMVRFTDRSCFSSSSIAEAPRKQPGHVGDSKTTKRAFSASASRDRERASRQNIVATLRLRIKNLEEKNRKLTGLLELVYGELALAREQNASVGSAP